MSIPRKVAIIDLKLGNLGSVTAFVARSAINAVVIDKPPLNDDSFTHIILPGVGSFSHGSRQLMNGNWKSYFDSTRNKIPLFGICLGMQLLASCGCEGNPDGALSPGLDYIKCSVLPLPVDKNVKLPHMGWNSIYKSKNSCRLLSDITDVSDFYFVHSYALYDCPNRYLVANANYHIDFPAIVQSDDLLVWGAQFHPEKSQSLGKKLLDNFLSL